MRERCNLAACEVADKSSKKCKECLKQPKSTAIQAWAIKAPDGHLISDSISFYSEGNSWCYFGMEKKDWARGKKQGYRCVRVRVEEIDE